MIIQLKLLLLCLAVTIGTQAQIDLSGFKQSTGVKATVAGRLLLISWPAGKGLQGTVVFDLQKNAPLFRSIGIGLQQIAAGLDPAFILTVGKRDLISQNGWNIFFDKVPNKPHQSFNVAFNKQQCRVTTEGAHTVVAISGLEAGGFTGELEITFYNGSPLLNIAAVLSTQKDSVAIIYDGGLVSRQPAFRRLAWSDTEDELQTSATGAQDTSCNRMVKYRCIIGENSGGSLALFPAPHQYFYPLDEAFNLKFVWTGNNYRGMVSGYGMGIRQDLEGDHRFVPWFNAPPGTKQRLNFFCLLGTGQSAALLAAVKQYTHDDRYPAIAGYKTMVSHFHNEFSRGIIEGKPVPDHPGFVKVFNRTGVNIVHLAEFHYNAHQKGPDEKRLAELRVLFDQCRRLSDKNFLLLPGEEPNEFFGGHWLDLFPRPVYWIMARKPDQPFVTNDPKYGKVYRIADKDDMLQLLEQEKGLAWTAHARTKGSTGFPDQYLNEAFFKSDHFMGAAWKSLPADLSQPRLGKRVLDLLDDLNNMGFHKHVIGEADLFSIEPENEMYAHLNVNYLQIDKLPEFNAGWQEILDVISKGKFFTTTGEILLPAFTINGKGTHELVTNTAGKVSVELTVDWTFPLNFIEIISGDGQKVYRDRINLNDTKAFGKQTFKLNTDLRNRKWARAEVWDVAANGAFTQTIWFK
ncbi:hypothetical protein A8C56_06805 [Niabella ginsenosidivorans]|uniref:Uncharacterized protein n=1 Tax=Niabella ginsenosidivorans TaxID=1176587 RepID=A0A1A9I2C3_9BACT|nr:hypothetical protein [Niabella ginsenosidivorans]ANH80724.1 hypothetical protein A8C56_06805 [Niabella ginsenosidivorans]